MKNAKHIIETMIKASGIEVHYDLAKVSEFGGVYYMLNCSAMYSNPDTDPLNRSECILINPRFNKYDYTCPKLVQSMFHELAHATGRAGRLARPVVMAKAKQRTLAMLSIEELIAERTSQLLMTHFGFDPGSYRDFSQLYIQRYAENVVDDWDLILAEHAAQRAFGYILNYWSQNENKNSKAA